ncbi:MAG: hypothetical protein IJ563_01665 [Selenomonadaceae bacterium]|nr:hypothetical protein [Selenomonadaceae bacterium]
MKKTIFIMILCLMVSSIASAAQVRICDFGLDTFVSRYNALAKSKNNPYIMKNPNKISSDSLYDYYGIALNNQTNGNGLLFDVNKEGYISSITLSNNVPNNGQNTVDAIINILSVIGANDDEITNFLSHLLNVSSSLTSGDIIGHQWISSANRYVIVGFSSIDTNIDKIDTFIFLASDNMQP